MGWSMPRLRPVGHLGRKRGPGEKLRPRGCRNRGARFRQLRASGISGQTHWPVLHRAGRTPPHRRGRIRPGSQRRYRTRCGHPVGWRARNRKVNATVRGRRPDCPRHSLALARRWWELPATLGFPRFTESRHCGCGRKNCPVPHWGGNRRSGVVPGETYRWSGGQPLPGSRNPGLASPGSNRDNQPGFNHHRFHSDLDRSHYGHLYRRPGSGS